MDINHISPKKLFGLKDNYTKEELKKSFFNKIYYIDNQNISNDEKKFLIQNYYIQYKKAKAELSNKNNKNNQMFITFNPSNIFKQINSHQHNWFKEFDNLLNVANNLNSNSNPNLKTKQFSTSYIKQQKINPDGTIEVYETTSKNTNGKVEKKTNSYSIDSKGNKINVK